MLLDGNIVSTLSVLYVEDSKTTREAMSILLNNKFKKVFVAKDGEEGLSLCKKNKSEIDIIITDVNMPKLSGIEMVKYLRNDNINIPVIFTSAYTDSDLLLGAMELGINDYLVKPFSIPNLFIRIEHIFEEIHYQHLASRQEKELNQYLELLNKVAIVSKTDPKGKILYINDIFSEISGYSKGELIGKSHNIVRHPDMPKEIFKELWNTIDQGNICIGKVKNKTKDGEPYYVNATILPIFDENESIIGFIGIRFLITEDEDNKREFRKKVVDHIKLSKENEIKLLGEITKLKEENKNYSNLILDLENEKKRTTKQYSQIVHYEEEIKTLKDNLEKNRSKFTKQLSDFAIEIRKLQTNNKVLEEKNKENIDDIRSRNSEIKKLQVHIEELNKIIVNLRDVIEFGSKK